MVGFQFFWLISFTPWPWILVQLQQIASSFVRFAVVKNWVAQNGKLQRRIWFAHWMVLESLKVSHMNADSEATAQQISLETDDRDTTNLAQSVGEERKKEREDYEF
ncbi:hypothetical protein TIFTF001_045959 [Ficus carica]|uniref:Uncharacterized protein n=1 Tax=Ficus carica TaxID=3494 RepID=A0AA87Z4C7_FICCA|nr:hypothetical protein TIFTF001_045959 [Ficus carica]